MMLAANAAGFTSSNQALRSARYAITTAVSLGQAERRDAQGLKRLLLNPTSKTLVK